MKKMVEKNEKKSNSAGSNTKEKGANLEVNIIPLLLYLLKKIWIIILVGLVAASAAFLGIKIIGTPTYRCGFTAYVNNKHAASSGNTDYLSVSDVNAAKELVKTYSAILTSNTILSSAKEEQDLSYSVAQLKGMVSTRIQDETEIIQVYVVARSPEESYKVAQAIASVSPQKMAEIVEGSSMKIVEMPEVPGSIYKPNYQRYTVLGFVAGSLLAILILIIIYFRNDTITDEAEVESRFNVPVLGVIPDVNSSMSGKSGYYYNYYYQQKNPDDSDKSAKNDSEKRRAES